MRIWSKSLVAAVTVVLTLCAFVTGVAAAPPKPAQLTYVYDYAGMMTADEQASLRAWCQAIDDATTAQVVVVTVKNLENGQDIFWSAQDLFDQWGIGNRDKNNGLLIYVAETERQWELHTGYGLEGALPDAYLSQAGQDIMVPRFREGDYYGGILGVIQERIIPQLEKEYNVTVTAPDGGVEPEYQSDNESDGFDLIGAIVLFVIIMIALRIFGRFGGFFFPFGGGGFGGTFRGGGGGGGFSGRSFGGGRSGGGGARGGW
jgi:uncharacterized protein